MYVPCIGLFNALWHSPTLAHPTTPHTELPKDPSRANRGIGLSRTSKFASHERVIQLASSHQLGSWNLMQLFVVRQKLQREKRPRRHGDSLWDWNRFLSISSRECLVVCDGACYSQTATVFLRCLNAACTTTEMPKSDEKIIAIRAQGSTPDRCTGCPCLKPP